MPTVVRFTKSIAPGPDTNQVAGPGLDLTEPLFYPAKHLTPPPHLARDTHREKAARAPPPPRASPAPFTVTPPHRATARPAGPAPYHARPAPESYFSAPLSFSGSGPGFNPAPAVTSTAAPLHYSPTPYVGYSHSQERQYSPPASPTPSLYHHPSPSPAVYQPYHTTDNSLGTYLISYLYLKSHIMIRQYFFFDHNTPGCI